MRKYHRWLSVVFGVFLLWIAVTGVASQIVPLIVNGGFEQEGRGAKPAAAAGTIIPSAQAHEDEADTPKPAFVCPAELNCRPKQPSTGLRSWIGYLHHLHSGEEFGPVGTVISLLSGIAMVFFSFSGLWMYIRMWSHRRDKEHTPAWFWK